MNHRILIWENANFINKKNQKSIKKREIHSLIEMDADKNARMITHLRRRPIARIFEQCREKDNDAALKLMCILDYGTERLDLYTKIQAASPKFLAQLMQFYTFASFKFYNYLVKKEIGARILRCKFCDLIGPYANILSHMAINHNAHIGVKMCVYCNRTELDKHFEDKTLDECYQKYVERVKIYDDEWHSNVCEIVAKFYGMLRKLSKKLDICSNRNKCFTGRGYGAVENLNQSYGNDFPSQCMVFKQQPHKNVKDLSTALGLDGEFKRVMSHFYGKQDNIPSKRRQPTNPVIIIDDQEQNIPIVQLRSFIDNGRRFQVSAK